jgi:hypothetical protein
MEGMDRPWVIFSREESCAAIWAITFMRSWTEATVSTFVRKNLIFSACPLLSSATTFIVRETSAWPIGSRNVSTKSQTEASSTIVRFTSNPYCTLPSTSPGVSMRSIEAKSRRREGTDSMRRPSTKAARSPPSRPATACRCSLSTRHDSPKMLMRCGEERTRVKPPVSTATDVFMSPFWPM